MSFREFLVRKEKIVGALASAFSVIMFISLIEVLVSNYAGDSRIIIQPLATSLNGLFWVLYAYPKKIGS